MATSSDAPRPPNSQLPPKGRQQPGLACNECRARKLRCDRQQPRCGSCETNNLQCIPNTVRQSRGPKRGHIRALQSRILALESTITNLAGDAAATEHLQQYQGTVDASISEQQLLDTLMDDPIKSMTVDLPVQLPSPDTGGHVLQLHDDPHSITQRESTQTMIPTPYSSNNEQLSGMTSQLESMQDIDYSAMMLELNAMHALSDIPIEPAAAHLTNVSPEIATDVWHKGTTYASAQKTPESASQPPLSPLMQADLEHLYFDRVHTFVPILNRRRYFARVAKQSSESRAFTCLQHAVWTLAASTSSQFQNIQHVLYRQTRTLLDQLEQQDAGAGGEAAASIEQTQAWTLLAVYEITQVDLRRGWLSAGRCFRLVLLMELHVLDEIRPRGDHRHSDSRRVENHHLLIVELEERRRTFWTAYSLDRFVNLLNDLPLTLSEQVIMTRLPAPESAFQRGHAVPTPFLSQALACGGPSSMTQTPPPSYSSSSSSFPSFSPSSSSTITPLSSSAFTDSILSVTITGRYLSHRQRVRARELHADDAPFPQSHNPQQQQKQPQHQYRHRQSQPFSPQQDPWTRHPHLGADCFSTVLTHTACNTSPDSNLSGGGSEGAMAVFARMAAHTASLLLCAALGPARTDRDHTRSNSSNGNWDHSYDLGGYGTSGSDCERRGRAAAAGIVELGETLAEFSYYKVHPLTPILLYLCADYMRARLEVESGLRAQYAAVYQTLRDLCAVNRLAQVCLAKLAAEREGSAGFTSVSMG